MSLAAKASAGIGCLADPLVRPSIAQGLVTQRNLSLALAKTIAEATLAECKSKGFNTAAAVVDRAGQVLVILRDEQGTAQMAEMARRKAYTARMFRIADDGVPEADGERPEPAAAARRAGHPRARWRRAHPGRQ